jgi:epoxyqueuosine reductase
VDDAASKNPPLRDLLGLDDAAFRARFRGTPLKRTGRNRLVRNALIAAGNSKDTSLIPAIERLARDQSPLVRAMAAWALSRLLTPEAFGVIARRLVEGEPDLDVRREWVADESVSP